MHGMFVKPRVDPMGRSTSTWRSGSGGLLHRPLRNVRPLSGPWKLGTCGGITRYSSAKSHPAHLDRVRRVRSSALGCHLELADNAGTLQASRQLNERIGEMLSLRPYEASRSSLVLSVRPFPYRNSRRSWRTLDTTSLSQPTIQGHGCHREHRMFGGPFQRPLSVHPGTQKEA